MTEQRIYVVVAATVQTPSKGVVAQPAGRQIAQVAHVVSKLRFDDCSGPAHAGSFQPITTIVLQARDDRELLHVYSLANKKKLTVTYFADTNESAYGPEVPGAEIVTAIAFFATKKQNELVADYLPLWGGK